MKSRMIEGKRYKSQGASNLKSDAERRAKYHRDKGRKARVIKCQAGYDVYTRG